jgi:hypothetical protein
MTSESFTNVLFARNLTNVKSGLLSLLLFSWITILQISDTVVSSETSKTNGNAHLEDFVHLK